MTDVIKYPLSVLDGLAEQTIGHDGLVRPGPADYAEGCSFNECQIRRQCTRKPCAFLALGTGAPSDNARAIAEAQERIEEEQRADVADRMLAREMERRDDEHLCDWGHTTAVPAPNDFSKALAALRSTLTPADMAALDTVIGRVEDLEQDARASETARLRAEVERLTGERDERQRIVEAHEDTIRHLEHDLEDARAKLTAEEHAADAMTARTRSLEHLRERLTAADAVTASLYRIADSLGAKLPPVEDREADDARLRISLGVAELQERAGRLERSRDYWQAKAKRLERRVAVLTEEQPRRREDRPDTAKQSKMRGIASKKQDRGAAARTGFVGRWTKVIAEMPLRGRKPTKQPRKRGGKAK